MNRIGQSLIRRYIRTFNYYTHPYSTMLSNDSISLYKRQLPLSVIPFSSHDGKTIFREALLNGTLETFFPLAEQFRTQDEPAFCALTTLTMVLNALQVDPLVIWKSPWRWFHETMLDCCVSLNVVKEEGLTFDQFLCLAECNGCSIDVSQRVSLTELPRENKRNHKTDCVNKTDCLNKTECPKKNSFVSNDHEPLEQNQSTGTFLQEHINKFRSILKIVSSNPNPKSFLIASYDRSLLGQTGIGHFSPIGGYDPIRDLVLIMDVARFKYPPHWVKIEDLVKSMAAVDPVTNLPRGYAVIRKSKTSDYGRLTLFKVELPRRVEAGKIIFDFFEIVKEKISSVPILSHDDFNSPRPIFEYLEQTFRCFLKALGSSTSMSILLSTAQPRDFSNNRRSSSFNETILNSCDNIVDDASTFDAIQSSITTDLTLITNMIQQMEAKPWYAGLMKVLHEEVEAGVLRLCQIEGFEFNGIEISDSLSPVSVEHLFVSFFLALLPHNEKFVPCRGAWDAITDAIDDGRLTTFATSCNSWGNCGNANSCDFPEEVDFVFAILKLREILDKLLKFCGDAT